MVNRSVHAVLVNTMSAAMTRTTTPRSCACIRAKSGVAVREISVVEDEAEETPV
jgi:hypothetical protein